MSGELTPTIDFAQALQPITPHLGARIHLAAADITRPDVAAEILEALNRHGILVFPGIGIDDEALVALSASLGELEAARVTADGSAASARGIYRIALDKTDKSQREYVEGNNYWHMDGTSYAAPGKATLLKCESAPRTGGETEFADLVAAYSALPEARRRALEDLRVIHCLAPVGRLLIPEPTVDDLARWNATFPPTEHPLVWTLPDGRRSLLIGSTAERIVGMPEADGRALLDELLDWCTQDRYSYRHRWQRGDLVIWHNPALLHRSLPYDEAAGRVMHRAAVRGAAGPVPAPVLN